MTTITLPRATVEQVLEALIIAWQQQPRWQITESMHNLRAALAQQADPTDPGHDVDVLREHVRHLERRIRELHAQQAEPVEPVAWRWGYRSVTTGEMDWRGYVEIAAHPNLRSPEIIMEPLYAAPPQRKPLTVTKLLPRKLPEDNDE